MTGKAQMDKYAFNLGKELAKKKKMISKTGKKPKGRSLLEVFGFNRDSHKQKRPLL